VITQALLGLVEGLVNLTFGNLPTGSAVGLQTWATSIVGAGFFNKLGWLNDYIPLDQVVAAITLLLSLATIMLVVRILIWLLSKFHVLGSD
jgi:hypothetical protein